MLDSFEGGIIHLRCNGRHLLKADSSIRGLRAVLPGGDKGFAPALEALAELGHQSGGLPLVVHAEYARFPEKLKRHELPGGVFYKVLNAPDSDSANRLMDAVREHRD